MGNHRLQIVTLDGRLVKTIGSEGSGDGQLSFPESVAVTPNTGYIVVSDLSNNRIQVF
jgi:DNA-binding beta-propeller fold protein YncE